MHNRLVLIRINLSRSAKIANLVVLCICFCLLFFQFKTGTNLRNYIFVKFSSQNKINKSDANIVVSNFRLQQLQMQKELIYLAKYKDIYDKLSTIKPVSILEAKYVVKDDYEHSILAISNNDDIMLNDVVVDKYNMLIGRIINYDKKLTTVQLVSDIQSNIPSMCQNGANGIIHGVYSADCDIEFFSLNGIIPYNDEIVLTSGFDKLVPRGIVIGKVKINNGHYCVVSTSNNFESLIVVR